MSEELKSEFVEEMYTDSPQDEEYDEYYMDDYDENPFNSSIIEKILALLIIPIAYFYVSIYYDHQRYEWNVYFGIFFVLFILASEILFWKVKRSAENCIFMVLMLIAGVATTFSVSKVWDATMVCFFTHLFAVYWILVRSNKLAEQETSHMFGWDGIMGFFRVPFTHFMLFCTTIKSFSTGKKKINMAKVIPALIAAFVGIILLSFSLEMLKTSDKNFYHIMYELSDFFSIDIDADFVSKVIFAIPVGMYLFALLDGCFREPEEYAVSIGNGVKESIAKLNKVVNWIWTVFIGLFSIFYIVFFVIQGSYLFGAFGMILPQEFTYSSYARNGFGQMCTVMVINMVLLWCAYRTSEQVNKVLKLASTLLVVESMIFAVIAFMKLLMYIVVYGFTQLRIQSIWLVTILTFACICILISMHTGRKTARIWFIGSCVLLCITCVI